MRRLAIAVSLAFLSAGSSAVVAHDQNPSWEELEEIFARGCGDDRGIDRCDSDVQRRMHELYGTESPADLLQQNVTARRAMFVDGYGNEVAAISFARYPGQPPMVEVRSPRVAGAPQLRPLTAAVGHQAWATALSRSKNFDQRLARELPQEKPEEDDALPDFCLHGWFVVVEAIDAPRVSPNVLAGTRSEDMERDPALPVEAVMEPGSIRSDAESACADGLAVDYAFELAAVALASLAECSTLTLDSFRNTAELLGQCHRLGGDRLAAGEANVTIDKLQRALRLDQTRELAWLFAGLGDTRAARFTDALDGGALFLNGPVGVDADHAEVEGQVIRFNEGDPVEATDISLKLLRQAGDFVIDTFEVSNRRPFSGDQ